MKSMLTMKAPLLIMRFFKRFNLRRRTIRHFTTITLLIIGNRAADSAPPATPVYVVDTLTVQALRTPTTLGSIPYSVNQIDVSQIVQLEPGLSLTEALASVPGVMVAERNNLSQGDRIAVRGIGARASFGVRGLRVLVDGIPLTMADGQSQLGVIDLSQMASIDVIRGPASALYGNAAGGVLHLRSRQVVKDALQISSFTGSDGLRQIRMGVDILHEGDQFQLGASHTDFNGDRQHAYSRQRTLQASWQRLTDVLELGITGHLYDAPWLYNPSSLDRDAADQNPKGVRFFVRQQGAAKQVRHAQLGARLGWRISTASHLQIAGHVVSRSLANPIPGRIIDLDRKAFGLRVVAHHRWQAAWETTLGVEVESQSDQRLEFANEGLDDDDIDRFIDDRIFDRISVGQQQIGQDESAVGVGLFMLTQWHPATAWTVSAGARVDRHGFDVDDNLEIVEEGVIIDGDDSGDENLLQWSPTLGVTYTPSPRLTLFANFSTAYLTPTTVELGNRADGVGGFNPDLDPEHYDSVEAGVRWGWPRHHIDGELAIYQLDLDDMLVPFQSVDSDETFYRNASAARNRGAEVHLGWQPLRALSLDGSVSIVDFVFTNHTVTVGGERVSVEGNQVPAVPPWSANLITSWRPSTRTQLRFTIRHQDRMFGNDLNGPSPGSTDLRHAYFNEAFTVVDLRVSVDWTFGVWDAKSIIGIDNILDTDYNGSVVPNAFGNRFFEPAPGRTFMAGMQLRR
jgi:iron complex outermembrane recepter protein